MNIIPKPFRVEVKSGFFQISSKSGILLEPFSEELNKSADIFAEQFRTSSGYELSITQKNKSEPEDIVLQITKTGLGEEGYKLNCTPKELTIQAETTAGIFYGLQSLIQLLPWEYHSKQPVTMNWKVPACTIEDQPCFSWRGMHLDVSRHFFGIEFIKKYIDLLAMQKLNIFHWHLTDDNGWRIEIKKYPELTKTCA